MAARSSGMRSPGAPLVVGEIGRRPQDGRPGGRGASGAQGRLEEEEEGRAERGIGRPRIPKADRGDAFGGANVGGEGQKWP
jgi:hypothetical protein